MNVKIVNIAKLVTDTGILIIDVSIVFIFILFSMNSDSMTGMNMGPSMGFGMNQNYPPQPYVGQPSFHANKGGTFLLI